MRGSLAEASRGAASAAAGPRRRPLVSTLAGLLLSNGGLIPCEHQAYAVVNRALLPLSIPLLLFSADLKRIVRLLGPLLLAFLLGSAATVVGAPRPRPPRRAARRLV